MKSGSLTVVGSGIKFASHMALEAKGYVEHADIVLLMVSDTITEEWLQSLNSNNLNLIEKFYHGGKERLDIYKDIANYIIEELQKEQNVCVVFYGHPGVFVDASFRAIELAKKLDYPAHMVPAISAEDCLYADLLVDPGKLGCQQYEVTQFLAEQPKFDPTANLILWQIGSLGTVKVIENKKLKDMADKLGVLQEYLEQFYPPEHPLTMYIAAIYPGKEPQITTFPLNKLAAYGELQGVETLFVPPYGKRKVNQEMLEKLGLA